MSNFKGTKGPWGYDIDENNYCVDLVLPNETVIYHARDSRYTGKYVIERDEMNANMRLISKAPEMLEMLERISERLDVYSMSDKDDKLVVEAIELIKSVTEI